MDNKINKISSRNIKEINKRLEYLYDKFNINPFHEDVKIGDEDLFISYPDDWADDTVYSISDFLKYTEYISEIEIVDNHSVLCGNIQQTIVVVDEYHYEHRVPDIVFESDSICMSLIDNPFLIGIIASRDGIYNEDFGVYPCSQYMAIEIEYKDESVKCDKEHIKELIKSFLYHISSKYEVPISIGRFFNWDDITDEEPEEVTSVNINDLLPYSTAMDYYIEALSIENNDIKYLYFYKILEYFSPIVSKKKSYEQLNQRLDILQVTSRNHEYLESIFQLTKQYEISLKDRELAFTILSECIDLQFLYYFLPISIQKNISKECRFKVENIDLLKQDEIVDVKKKIGEILYSTRNNIVHAKSNYSSTGKECQSEDLAELNEFMAKLCHCLIVWNGRQSKEFQLK